MHEPLKFPPKPLALAVAIATGTVPVAASAAAGRIQFAYGQVSIEDASGAQQAAKKGSEIDSGDTIVTERGRAQIKFTDGAFVSLQPKTSFKVEDYNFEGKEDGSERSVFNMFRGGLRTITGIIGRRNKNAYRMNTPVATIGIRGTAYKMQFQPDGSLALGTADGTIFASNDGGTTYYGPGATGVVINQFTQPSLATGDQGEQLLVLRPPPRVVNDEQIPVIGDDGTPEEIILEITDLDAQQICDLLIEAGLSPVEAEAIVAGIFPGFVKSLAAGELFDGPGYATAFAFYCDGCEGGNFPIAEKEFPVTADFTDGKLEGWMSDPANRDQLTLSEADSDNIIGWGRWTFDGPEGAGGNFDEPGPDNSASFDAIEESLHYVVGRPSNMAQLASNPPHIGRFSLLANTTPTRKDGLPGTFNGATLTLSTSPPRPYRVPLMSPSPTNISSVFRCFRRTVHFQDPAGCSVRPVVAWAASVAPAGSPASSRARTRNVVDSCSTSTIPTRPTVIFSVRPCSNKTQPAHCHHSSPRIGIEKRPSHVSDRFALVGRI